MSAELADLALEQAPGGGPELALPALVETAAELGAESRDVRGVEDHAARGELIAELAVQVVGVGALQGDVLLHVALHDLLHVPGQRVPELQVGEQVEARPHVVGGRDVLRHLVEPVHLGDDQRVFLAVDLARLERRVELADVDRHRLRLERREHVAEHLAVGNAHPHAAQVLGDEDRLVDRRDLPEAVLEQPVLEAVDALRRAFAADILAERAVEYIGRECTAKGIYRFQYIYSPSAPSFARCTCAWLVKAKGMPWISATGTLRPRMPPISVKNSSSPLCSRSSAPGSEPGRLSFCG